MFLNALQKEKLILAAAGKIPPDTLIKNGRLINVYSSEIIDSVNVSLLGSRIAYVGTEKVAVNSKTKVIDASGCYLSPGFIEPHFHLDFITGLFSFSNGVIPHGTTAVITDLFRWGRLWGNKGSIDFALFSQEMPIHIFLAPTPDAVRKGAGGSFKKLMKLENVLELGEATDWPDILNGSKRVLSQYHYTEACGKRIEGHTAGAKGLKLAGLAASGISACHEPIKAEEIIERVRLGIYGSIRSGSIRDDLKAIISQLLERKFDTKRVLFNSDWKNPPDLLKGHINIIVKNAIEAGLNPIEAYRMATLNPAEYFRIDNTIGGIAPGRFADILLIPDIKEVKPRLVIAKGKVVFEKGNITTKNLKIKYPDYTKNSLGISPDFKASDFIYQYRNKEKIPILQSTGSLINKLVYIENEKIDDLDIVIVAMVKRNIKNKPALALASGFGLKAGALASSVGLDTQDLFIFGKSHSDMAIAANKVCSEEGGICFVKNGRVEIFLKLPIGGILSEEPVPQLAKKWNKLNEIIVENGVKTTPPLLSILFITFTMLPFCRMTVNGLFDVVRKKYLT